MLFTTILASTIALGMGVSAAPTASPSPNPNYRYVQLRVFGAPGCSELNQGELGVYGDSLNKCQTFSDITIKSVSFEAKYQESCTGKLSQHLSLFFFFFSFFRPFPLFLRFII